MKIIIGGAGEVGTHLARLLSRDNHDITLMDESQERLAGLDNKFDIMTLQGAPTSIQALKDANAENADLFVGVTPEESTNINACIMAHAIGAKKTVARIDNYEYMSPDLAPFFKELGIDSLIYPEMLAAKDIINGLKMSWVRQRWDVHDGVLTLLGIKLRQTSNILNRPLKDLCGPDDPYIVVAIKRGDETIIPRGNDELHNGDLAYFMTMPKHIPYIREIAGKAKYPDVKNVIIMGGGKTAVRAALTAPDNMHIKIIERDPKRCERLNQLLCHTKNTMVIEGDGRDVSLLMEEGIRNVQAFVALTTNAETNILASMTAMRMGVSKTIARVENLDYIAMAESLDIGTIINKKTIAASHIYQMLLDADVSNVRSLMVVDSDVAEFVAAPDSPVTKKPVKALGLPFGVTIGGLVRNDVGMLVNGNSQIEAGDSVMVFCHEHNLNKVEKFFKPKGLLW
ncbi:MAG: Trk system potassium transporter TrkA [Prevotella sp.]|nr:Trk system potassium transporter TrkA [Prevotella sp.]